MPGDPTNDLALGSHRGRVALAATVAGSSMASLDATVVNIALPDIGKDLGASVTSLQWVLTGYLLSLASLILLGGALGDRFGRRRIFLIGTTWFALASLLCGAAPNIEVLIAARFLQGIGGALLTPGSLAILQASFRKSDRSAAVGAWSGLGGVAGAIGPFIGGALVDGPGWRWAFLINLPIAFAVLVSARAAVPETREAEPRALDLRGAALAVAGLAAATWALTQAGRRGWGDTGVLVAAAAAVALGVAFVVHIRRTTDALVPPELFRSRTFTVLNVGTAFLYAAIGLAFFLVAYELQVAAGWSALASGVALLPTTVLMIALSSRSATLAQRLGPRLQLTLGPVLCGAGLLLLTRIGPETTWATDVLPGSVLFGVGLVTFVAPLTATVMAAADPEQVNIASAVNNAIARTASLAAIATIPVVAALPAAVGAVEVTTAYRTALVISAALTAMAGLIMAAGLSPQIRMAIPARRFHCAIDGPPIQEPTGHELVGRTTAATGGERPLPGG